MECWKVGGGLGALLCKQEKYCGAKKWMKKREGSRSDRCLHGDDEKKMECGNKKNVGVMDGLVLDWCITDDDDDGGDVLGMMIWYCGAYKNVGVVVFGKKKKK